MDTKHRSSTDPNLATDTEETGFLSRWSRRKAQVRQGVAPVEPAAPAPVAPVAVQPPPQAVAEQPAGAVVPAEPLPTLDDVAALTRDSDYTRFVGRSVQPEVRNAALGKLFSDPHFNVMDGLDTYIDDYGKPDPLPAGMLRKMAQAHLLGLFDDDDKKTPPATPAQPDAAAPPPPDLAADENTDLQLQPDDDAGRPGPAPGAGEDAGLAH